MCPFKSESQRRKFAEMVKDGKITQETYDAWNAETKTSRLPDRVSPKSTQKVRLVPKVKVVR